MTRRREQGIRSAARRHDPTGKSALFGAPVQAAPDIVSAGAASDGRAALFSTGPRRSGTVVVHCDRCEARSRIGLGDLANRLLGFSLYLPLLRRDHPHRMTCPSCETRAWCRIGWSE